MMHVLVKHKVTDFSKWKTEFDDFSDTRKAGGEKSYEIFHLNEDPENVVLLFEWDNRDNARTFLQSDALKERMSLAGVLETPEILFLDEVEKATL